MSDFAALAPIDDLRASRRLSPRGGADVDAASRRALPGKAERRRRSDARSSRKALLVTLNGAPARLDGAAERAAQLRLARALRPDRRQGRLQRRRLRRLHGADRRRAGLRLPDRRSARSRAAASRRSRACRDADPARRAACARAFHCQGAAQCGICTPAALLAAVALLRRDAAPERDAEIEDALGGVLCRCTGYRAIVEAVAAAVCARPRPRAAARSAARAAAARRRAQAHRRGDLRRRRMARRRADARARCARRTRTLSSRSAISTPASPRIPASSPCSPPRTCPARTVSASSPPSPTSRRWPKAARCFAARRWRWSSATKRRCRRSTSPTSP